MPERVEAARAKVRRWGQGRIEEPRNYGPRALPHIRAYRRASRWQDRDIDALIAATRAEERNRLLNPSDELVEAVAKAEMRATWDQDSAPCPPWDECPDVLRDLLRVSARAALQAAGSALDGGAR